MKVLKFGGTSVQDAKRINTVLKIAAEAVKEPGGALLVSSALSGITDNLLEIAKLARLNQKDEVSQKIDTVRQRHLDTASDLVGDSPQLLDELTQSIEGVITQIRSLAHGVLLLRECSPRTSDAIVGCGELLSTLIIASAALSRGFDAIWVDARECIRTDTTFGAAHVDFEKTDKLTLERIIPRDGRLYISQGFIGSTTTGVTSTLGRSGSDYSAAIFASALSADVLEIWTDVDGIMTTDPRIVTEAVRVPALSYAEAAELAYFGAKVVHPATMQPAIGKNIPIYVRNTHNPTNPGTCISNEERELGLRAIAEKKSITVVTIQSSRMLHAYGFMENLFGIFARNHVSVDLVTTSEVSVSVSLDTEAVEGDFENALVELKKLGEVSIEKNMAIICLVGYNLWKNAVFTAKVFNAIQDIPVRMISLGASDVNLSLIVPEKNRIEAVKELHAAFFHDSSSS